MERVRHAASWAYTTAPVLAYYERLGVLRRIDAGRPIEDVYARRLLNTLSREASTRPATLR